MQLTFRELQVLFDCIITGIAHAVSEYAQQRDAELLRQANEHFALHRPRAAQPAVVRDDGVRAPKSNGQLPADSRSVGALERGLQRTSELIDQTLQIARVASGIELRRQSTTLRALFEDVELGAISEAEVEGRRASSW